MTSSYLQAPLRSLDEVLGEREAKWQAYCGEVQKAAAETPIVARDLCDFATTADEIAAGLLDIGKSLGRAHEDGDPMPPQTINNLFLAQSRIGALIAELEAEATR